MNINDQIQKMKESIFTDDFFHEVYSRYLREESAKEFSLSEQEYAEAHAVLPPLLSEEQKRLLDKAEKASEKSARWLA